MKKDPEYKITLQSSTDSIAQGEQHQRSRPAAHLFNTLSWSGGNSPACDLHFADTAGELRYYCSLVLGLVLALNLDAQTTANTPPALVTTQVISTNSAQTVTMVVIQSQPMTSATGGLMSPLRDSTCATCPDSAVAWWAGEGDASDSLGAHNGTIHNSVGFMQGEVGDAFSFAGNNYMDTPNSGLIYPSWSFEVWVNPTAAVTSQVWLAGQSYGRQLLLRPGASGPKVALGVSTSPYNWQVFEGAEIPTNVWSHVVGVCDSANGALRLYVNGSGQSTALGLVPWDSGCSWSLGAANACGYSGQFFRGGLDEFTIYDAALTSDQVQALYLASDAGKCQPVINATRDLLLVYNTSSSQSCEVKDYYLAHRPMVAGANVCPITCPPQYTISPSDYSSMVETPLLDWLTAHPSLRPQYIILFLDVPSRINTQTNTPPYPVTSPYSSISYSIHTMLSGYRPYVTHINMRDNDMFYTATTDACIAYIDKLQSFGSYYSLSSLIISPSAGGYNNTNYIVDNVRNGTGCYDSYAGSSPTPVADATNGLYAAGVPASAILYADGQENCSPRCGPLAPHITNAVNVAGYVSWGSHSSLCNEYAIYRLGTDWQGDSGWWLIETIESFNGAPFEGQGDFYMWFDHRGFGGTEYENTPVGAVTHVDEPGLADVNNTSTYFGMWASGANFATCAWESRNTDKFQAVGDPFVTR
jgi:hypothetical protein